MEAAPETTTPAPESFTKEQVQSLALQAAQAAIHEFKEKNPSLTQDEVKKAILDDRKNLANQILGHTGENKKDPVKELLEQDPTAALGVFGDALRGQVKKEILDEFEGKITSEREMRAAANEVMKERPDIASNEQTQKLVVAFYKETQSDLPEKERWKEAVKQADLLLEAQGLGDKDARLQKFTSVQSASGKAPSPQATTKTETEFFKDHADERMARFQKTRNIS